MFCWRNYPVLVLIERKSRFIIIARLNGRLADETVQGLRVPLQAGGLQCNHLAPKRCCTSGLNAPAPMKASLYKNMITKAAAPQPLKQRLYIGNLCDGNFLIATALRQEDKTTCPIELLVPAEGLEPTTP